MGDRILKQIIVLIALLQSVLMAQNLDLALSMDVGESKDGIDIYRVGIQKEFDTTFYENETLYISGYHELSLNYWEKNSANIAAIAYSPVFTLNFITSSEYTPYIEAGVGVAALSNKKIDSRDLSSTLQFEDRFGVGLKRANFDFHIRYMHYSTGGFKKPNDGIDIFLAGFAYNF